jgi:hypothetical protein
MMFECIFSLGKHYRLMLDNAFWFLLTQGTLPKHILFLSKFFKM